MLGIVRVHVVGISMGGGIAQQLALEHGDRVATLSLISTTPVGPRRAGTTALPGMSAELTARLAEPAPEPDWSDREAVVDSIVEGLRPFAGSLPFDEERQRALVERVYDRTVNIASSIKNHWLIDGGEPVRGRLGELRMPTLVLHGTEDPLFPYEHAEALVDEIPAHLCCRSKVWATRCHLGQSGDELPRPFSSTPPSGAALGLANSGGPYSWTRPPRRSRRAGFGSSSGMGREGRMDSVSM
jgi:alpha-beta hydrolase superfamily lysophospholipase